MTMLSLEPCCLADEAHHILQADPEEHLREEEVQTQHRAAEEQSEEHGRAAARAVGGAVGGGAPVRRQHPEPQLHLRRRRTTLAPLTMVIR